MPSENDPVILAVTRYWERINIYDGFDLFQRSVQSLPRSSVFLYAAHLSQSEIRNGGLLQLFWNSSGILVPEAIQGYTCIGMPQLAGIVEQAATKLGEPYQRDREQRWQALLDASNLGMAQFEKIFSETPDFFLGYRRATKSLNLEELDRRSFQLLETENGGFEQAFDRYAQSIYRSQ